MNEFKFKLKCILAILNEISKELKPETNREINKAFMDICFTHYQEKGEVRGEDFRFRDTIVKINEE